MAGLATMPVKWNSQSWSRNRLSARGVRSNLRGHPIHEVGPNLQGRLDIMFPFGQIDCLHGETFLSSAVKKAFHLRPDVELILAAPADEHVQLTFLNVVGIKHFQRVFSGQVVDGIRVTAIINGIEEAPQSNEQGAKPAHDLPTR